MLLLLVLRRFLWARRRHGCCSLLQVPTPAE